jgi:predicted nucleic acid-binding protein
VLSFYGASWAAAAAALNISLVSADRRLLAAGLAETPTAAASRLNL